MHWYVNTFCSSCVEDVLLYLLNSTEILCEELQNPTNGQVFMTGQSIGSTATYTCDSGYELIGDDRRTCEDGEWTGQEPTCVGIIHIHIDTVCTPLISHL